MARRLKPVKDLSVLILAPKKHDRQLWANLLKNCGIMHPLSMGDVDQAAAAVSSGQADVVFVDESYGPEGITNVLLPARDIEFAGGRGVCLILCAKKATAQDVMNARLLGFASLVILPVSMDTLRKHLELAARYIPPTDEELGWSSPKAREKQEAKAMPTAKDDPDMDHLAQWGGEAETGVPQAKEPAEVPVAATGRPHQPDQAAATATSGSERVSSSTPADESEMEPPSKTPPPSHEAERETDHISGRCKVVSATGKADEEPPKLKTPGRSGGKAADEEVVFL